MLKLKAADRIKDLTKEIKEIRAALESSFTRESFNENTDTNALLNENRTLKLTIEEKDSKIQDALKEVDDIKTLIKDTINSI